MAVRKQKVDRNPNGVMNYDSMFTIGCDPEVFLTDAKGKIVGSERVIPKKGLSGSDYGEANMAVRDGVQIELHPEPTTCRANVGNGIQYALQALESAIKKDPKLKDKFKVSFADVVEVSKRELLSLSPEARQLGCMPSLNIYGPSKIKVNPLTYRKRSGGGHIHMSGIPSGILADKTSQRNLVFMMDAIVGNTCVLIDRSPNARIRRRTYGQAGEYRLPKYGIEYRTLSNFWMHAYPLFSLAAALCRMAASASNTSYTKKTGWKGYRDQLADLEGIILDTMNIKKVRQAINRNDLDLAKENWAALRPIIVKYYDDHIEGIHSGNIAEFEFFAAKIQEKAASGDSKYNGLDAWWDHDPFQHWVHKAEGHGTGWESFLTNRVRPALKKVEKEKKEQEKKDADPDQAAA